MRQLSNVIFKLDNLFPLVAFETLYNLSHLAFQRVLDLDRDVEAFRMKVEVLVNPKWMFISTQPTVDYSLDGVRDDYGIRVGQEAGHKLWKLVKCNSVL